MDSPSDAAKLRKEYRTLLTASMSPGGLDSVRSAAKNAVSMSKDVPLSVSEKLKAMRLALKWIENGCIPCQSRSFGRF